MAVNDTSYEAIMEGAQISRRYRISPEVYARFIDAFEDVSPVHVEDEYARARGFREKVMHGAILNGFVSNFVGVHFPGRRALLLSVDLRYSSPSYIADALEVRATVVQKMDGHRVVLLNLEIANLTQNTIAARGRAQVAIAHA